MKRLIVSAVLAAGCGNEDKKPAPPDTRPNPMFDKQAPPRGAKKGPAAG